MQSSSFPAPDWIMVYGLLFDFSYIRRVDVKPLWYVCWPVIFSTSKGRPKIKGLIHRLTLNCWVIGCLSAAVCDSSVQHNRLRVRFGVQGSI